MNRRIASRTSIALGLTALVTAASVVAPCAASATDTYYLNNNGLFDLPMTGDGTSYCVPSGLSGGNTSFTVPATTQTGTVYAQLSWSGFWAGTDCDNVHYSAQGSGPYPGMTNNFAFYARDPEYGKAWLHCSISGTLAKFSSASVSGLTCTVAAPTALRGDMHSADVRIVRSRAVPGRKSLGIHIARYGSERSGTEEIIAKTASGKLIARVQKTLKVGQPAWVHIPASKHLLAKLRKKNHSISVRVRHADGTPGSGHSAVLTTGPSKG